MVRSFPLILRVLQDIPYKTKYQNTQSWTVSGEILKELKNTTVVDLGLSDHLPILCALGDHWTFAITIVKRLIDQIFVTLNI